MFGTPWCGRRGLQLARQSGLLLFRRYWDPDHVDKVNVCREPVSALP